MKLHCFSDINLKILSFEIFVDFMHNIICLKKFISIYIHIKIRFQNKMHCSPLYLLNINLEKVPFNFSY